MLEDVKIGDILICIEIDNKKNDYYLELGKEYEVIKIDKSDIPVLAIKYFNQGKEEYKNVINFWTSIYFKNIPTSRPLSWFKKK